MVDRKQKFPEHIRKKLEQNGYFSLSKEERIKENEKCLEKLSKIYNPDFQAGISILRLTRGDNI